ncbi:MAG: calcium-translocating P-type ATPase, SERCA-type [Candidatus Omnitrophota bacterium]|jgi:Ca2+-transporting ATPase
MQKWWQLSTVETAKALSTDLSAGLTTFAAKEKLVTFGPNQLQEKKGRGPWSIFFEQFRDFIIWVLLGAALVSGFLKEWVDALAIICIVIMNAFLGFIQEFRAEKALSALKKLSSPSSKIVRDNERKMVPSADLVPGDVIELEAGDYVPADSRLVWVSPNFNTLEASLTGESLPVAKTINVLEAGEVPLAERANMVYMGTSVSNGKARALVVETGMKTELGKIAGMIQSIDKEETPLQKKLEQFGKWIVYVCFVLVGLVFVLGIVRGGSVLDMFLTSVSLAVAAIPEGLPAIVTIALALGVQRMVKRHALIRKLPSVETLGCATVICSDKTGTLTKNEMTVKAVFSGGLMFEVTGVGYEPKGEFLKEGRKVDVHDHPDLRKSLLCSVLCNGAELRKSDTGYTMFGDPTEGAMLVAAAKLDIWKKQSEEAFPFVEEIPFDSERKKMSVVRKDKSAVTAFVKGAPDILLNNCTDIEENGVVRKLTDADKLKIMKANTDLANQAMRVLGVSYRNLEGAKEKYTAEEIEKNLVFCGLLAMIDPPRMEVKEAIKRCETAGIKAVMITGDHKNTAVAIARELNIFGPDSLALTGEELDLLSDEELRGSVRRIAVYARVSPEHKLRVVRSWRSLGEIVAMTGDGVNDAPAVKEADIGVAMGITGTDVTKEVSDMVVTDDNFASIVAAVEEGRGIYDNIKKFIHYLLSCNTGEILVMFTASLIGWPVPLLPIHILWVNLVTDGLPALALGVDPVDPHIMERHPRKPNERVIPKQQAFIMVFQGSFIAFCSLLAFYLVQNVEHEGLNRARTAAFIVLACSQLFHSFNCRNMRESIFKIGFFTNKKLIIAVLISFLLQMAVVYIPFLQRIFKTEPLGFLDWVLAVLISSLPLWAMEVLKLCRKK